jgi:N-acetylmuramic acid 6-phosphate etherase
MITEQQNPKTLSIDQLSTFEVLERINDEDATVASAVRRALPEITRAVDAITERLRGGGRLLYVGAGTSGRLGVLDAVECVPTFSTPPELVLGLIAGGTAALTRSVENVEDMRENGGQELRALELSERDAVVGLAASGRTPYVLGAVETANEIGAVTIGIACNFPSPLLDLVQIPIGVVTGPEVITGSTRMKAGTAQKMVLNMLSTATMVQLGKVYGNLMVDLQVTNAKLADRARRIVAKLAEVDEAESAQLLAQTGNRVKAAIVMKRLGVSPEEAQARLQQANGRLRDVIG